MVLRSVRFSMSGWNADDRIWSLYMSHFIYCFTYLGLLVCWRVSYSFHVKIITLRVMIIVFVCAYVYVLSYNCWMNNFSNHLFILYCVCFKSFREVRVITACCFTHLVFTQIFYLWAHASITFLFIIVITWLVVTDPIPQAIKICCSPPKVNTLADPCFFLSAYCSYSQCWGIFYFS